MPEFAQFACHVMRAGAGFHDDGASVEVSEELGQLLTRYLPSKHGVARLVLAVKVKRTFAEIDSNYGHILHGVVLRLMNPFSVTHYQMGRTIP